MTPLAIPAGIEVVRHFYMRDDAIMIPLDGIGALTPEEWAEVGRARNAAYEAGGTLKEAAAAAFDAVAKTGKVTKLFVGRAVWKLIEALPKAPVQG